MSERLHVHLPYRNLEAGLPLVLEQGLQPEIAFRGTDLDTASLQELRGLGRRLADAGLAVTVHGPFHDLNPGALEPLVWQATRQRFLQTLEAAAALQAQLVVFHPGYEHWKYGGQDHLWLEQNLLFWPLLLVVARQAGIQIAVENIFETSPATLLALFQAFPQADFGHCFDVGHWQLFADTSLADWFAALGPRLLHLHLHDNHGAADDHLPVGEGVIDFAALFSLVRNLPRTPSMTLEAHDQEALQRSLFAVAPFLRR
jgi:sugar phosphate isomerase/epimerase